MKIEKGKCLYEVYVNGIAVKQEKHLWRTSKFESYESALKFVKQGEKVRYNNTFEIIPYCPHVKLEDCQGCTEKAQSYSWKSENPVPYNIYKRNKESPKL